MKDLYIENNTTKTLDYLLEEAKSGKYDLAPFGVVCGLTGFGKTASVKAWLNHYNMKHLYISAPQRNITEIEAEVFNTSLPTSKVSVVNQKELEEIFMPRKTTLNVMFTSDEIDAIDENTVVVIDDYCMATKAQRKELLKYIRKCIIADPRSESGYTLKNPLFIIIIIDQTALITNNPLSDSEIKLFRLEKYL